jgi:hypothetical protein
MRHPGGSRYTTLEYSAPVTLERKDHDVCEILRTSPRNCRIPIFGARDFAPGSSARSVAHPRRRGTAAGPSIIYCATPSKRSLTGGAIRVTASKKGNRLMLDFPTQVWRSERQSETSSARPRNQLAADRITPEPADRRGSRRIVGLSG